MIQQPVIKSLTSPIQWSRSEWQELKQKLLNFAHFLFSVKSPALTKGRVLHSQQLALILLTGYSLLPYRNHWQSGNKQIVQLDQLPCICCLGHTDTATAGLP